MQLEIPDRLAVDRKSPYHDSIVLAKGVEIRFNGNRQVNSVVEYCISEGWVIRRRMTAHGKIILERGQPVFYKSEGKVEVEWANG